MLKQLTETAAGRVLALTLTATFMLAACDQVGTRIERAKEIVEASGDQISGKDVIVSDGTRNLETASVEARALAGTVLAQMNIDPEERPMFAIGSIIAKPIDIPPVPVEALEIEEEFYFEEGEGDLLEEESAAMAPDVADGYEAAPPPVEETPAPSAPSETDAVVETARFTQRVRLDPKALRQTREEIARAGEELEEAIEKEAPIEELKSRRLTKDDVREMAPAERREIVKLARRAPISRSAVVAQIDANEVMLSTLTKYGMAGNVALSREGQMVIQIGADGADPTQFNGDIGNAGVLMASAEDAVCPDTADLEQIQANPVWATACVVEDLEASGQFEYVEKDFIFQNQFVRRPKETTPPTSPGAGSGTGGTPPPATLPVSYLPNDPLWDLQWHFRDNGTGPGLTPGGAGFESFWRRQAMTGSPNVVVAVVDTGLQLQHPDIASSPNIMPGWDMVSDPRMGNDGDGRDADPNDPGDMCDPTKPLAADSFHGTHVAGTVGAASTNNGSGVAGGAWNVKIVPVRALGKCGGRLSDINDAIRWAGGVIPAEAVDGTEVWNANPAHVINLSIGLLGACPASLQDAIDSVTSRGVMVVSAAGNARMSTSFYAPAGCRNVITVAASDARGQITPYSNFGPEVTLLAPGGDLTRDDNGDGKPDGVLSTKTASNCYDPVTGETIANCFYAYEQGTSMAAPHVSAALALLKGRDPGASSETLVATLRAALDPRAAEQCAGLCSSYPGTAPIPGSPDMCSRPCGGGLLNLANISAPTTGGGSR